MRLECRYCPYIPTSLRDLVRHFNRVHRKGPTADKPWVMVSKNVRS